MSNETDIESGQQQIVDQGVLLEAELAANLTSLQAIADLSVSSATPTLSYSETISALANFATDVTAIFDSGISYPDVTDYIDSAKLDGYDSEFLQYLEGALTTNQPPTWAATLKSIKDGYEASTNVSAQNFIAGIIPSAGNGGNTFAVSMLTQINDTISIQATESTLLWNTISNDLFIEYQQKHHKAGINIEEIRAKITLDMIHIHSDYNKAILMQARIDFAAIKDTVDQIRTRISMQIKEHATKTEHSFQRIKLQNRDNILELDKDIATIRDDLRRTHVNYQLQLNRGISLVNYAAASVAQNAISGTLHGSFTSGTEG